MLWVRKDKGIKPLKVLAKSAHFHRPARIAYFKTQASSWSSKMEKASKYASARHFPLKNLSVQAHGSVWILAVFHDLFEISYERQGKYKKNCSSNERDLFVDG